MNQSELAAPPDFSGILRDILGELRRQNMPDDLWTTEQIATYLGLSVGSVRNRIITHATFPRPVRLPTTENGGGRRWLSKEVKAWVLKHKEAI